VSALRLGKLASALLAAVLATAVLAQSATAGTLYVPNYSDETFAAFSIGGDGLLAPLTGSPFQNHHPVYGLGITPDGRLLIASSGFDQYLETFTLGADGSPSPAAAPMPAAAGDIPAVTPNGRFVYLQALPKGIAGYGIGSDGGLTSLGAPVGTAGGPIAITPDGRFLFQGDYFTGTIARYSIGADGALAPLAPVPLGLPHGPDYMRITPDGKFAVTSGRDGPSGEEKLRTYAIGSDGSLTSTGSVLTPIDDTTGELIVSPNGHFAYTPSYNEASVTTYSIDPTGKLAQVGTPAPSGVPGPAALGMSVDGRFLYAEPMHGEQVQAFSVAGDGTLTKIGAPAPTGGSSDNDTPLARPSDPVASFTAKPGPPHGKTRFDANASHDTTAKIVTYEWDFGDGATKTTSTPTTTHNYKKAGAYTVTLGVIDDNGCSGYSYTGQTAYCGGKDASATVDTLPAIFGIKVTKGKRGTTLHYRLSEKAKVAFTIRRKLRGHRFSRVLLRFKAKGKAGKNARRLPTRTKHGPLGPGAYRVTAVATDSAKGKSATRSVRVTLN